MKQSEKPTEGGFELSLIQHNDQISDVKISDFTSEFIIDKTRYDVKEMNRLQKLMLENPDQTTKFYREQMGYKNRELKKFKDISMK